MKVSDSSCSFKASLSFAYNLLSTLDSFMHAGLENLIKIVLFKRFSFKRLRLYLCHI